MIKNAEYFLDQFVKVNIKSLNKKGRDYQTVTITTALKAIRKAMKHRFALWVEDIDLEEKSLEKLNLSIEVRDKITAIKCKMVDDIHIIPQKGTFEQIKIKATKSIRDLIKKDLEYKKIME